MRLYDQLSGRVRELSIDPRMCVYVCGITPYDSAHLGHAFTYVHYDVLVRYLRHRGAEVEHVQNVTDVDDDILRVAAERGVDWQALAEQETAEFEEAMRAINVTRPTRMPWASDLVAEILADVEELLRQGVAYERAGTVYFRVSRDPEYGRLSKLSRDEMLALAAERGGYPDDPAKDDPLDFVLWQLSKPGEPSWESPWGLGRPGWHIECSTMAHRILGQPVDVHGGGSDLIFPHHESELAQSEALPREKPFVRHWMHTAMVRQGGEKMSKSLGNMTFVQDLLKEHEPMALRRFLLRRHYRQEWEFRLEDLEREIGSPAPAGGAGSREAFFAALEDDLNVPHAVDALLRGADIGEEPWMSDARHILGLDA